MTPAAPSLFTRLRAMSFPARAGILVLVMALGYAVVAAVGARVGAPGAWGTGAAAAGVCLLGAVLALAASHSLRGPHPARGKGDRHLLCEAPEGPFRQKVPVPFSAHAALVAMLLAMACRMGLPLAFAAWAHLSGGPLARAGVLYYVLVFYLIALGAEVILALPMAEAPASAESRNRDSQ